MDELLAIIVIVILCCVMFFAWLVSMATCPDAMVSFLSGSRYSDLQELVKSVSSVYLQLNAQRKMSDKKLSVVPEADEQLTVQSTIHSMRPSILRAPSQPNGEKKLDIAEMV
ncbi:unnamed protein product [Cylicostephanus goldi]|uniref:Uncharacterized protein n=1 Tax=Cylicostephanus goldi TaxID=71465 RepID=A0A3P7MR78_CYLGO|nr:unnamed protein product [Cylicostephanus goldi]